LGWEDVEVSSRGSRLVGQAEHIDLADSWLRIWRELSEWNLPSCGCRMSKGFNMRKWIDVDWTAFCLPTGHTCQDGGSLQMAPTGLTPNSKLSVWTGGTSLPLARHPWTSTPFMFNYPLLPTVKFMLCLHKTGSAW